MTCLIMLVVVLTGCSTFRVDKVKYYNEVLAKVGNDNITRFDLINAYNNYGYTNFVTQGGQSEEEALVSTMDSLVKRKLAYKYALDNEQYSLSEYEITKLFNTTMDSLLSSFESNKSIARKIYNLEVDDKDAEAEESSTESIKLSEYGYVKRVEVVEIEQGEETFKQIKYKNIDTEKDADEIKPVLDQKYVTGFSSYTKYGIVKALLAEFMERFYANENNEDAELYKRVCDKAIELSCNNLINYEYYLREDGKRLSTNQEDLLYRFVERTYQSQLESAYITKINTVYLQTETLSNDSITNAFKAMYQSDYAKYANDIDAYNQKIISTGSDLIYYHPVSNDDFGYFLHVLLPLNNVEDDLTWLKEHRYLYSDDEYLAKQQEYLEQIMCAERTISEVRDDETGELVQEEGIVLDSQKSISDVLAEYRDEVKDLDSFKKFMFKYTTDTATLTADMPYVIGYNPETYTGKLDGDGKLTGAHTTMVNNFTREAIRLMKENKTYTNYDEYILTNYGIHLLYYVAPVTSPVGIENLNKVTVEQLDALVLNQATGETYLDRVFDLVYPADSNGMFTSNTKYSSYEQTLVESLYAIYPVEINETKLKASTKI